MALPNTNAKSSTNMIGERVENTSRSGTRLILIRLRFATTMPSPSRLGTAAHRTVARVSPAPAASVPSFGAGLAVAVFFFGDVAGERQEHVVQGGAAQRRCRAPARRPRRAAAGPPRSTSVPPVTGTVSRAGLLVDDDLARASGLSADRARGSVPRSATVSSTRSPPTWLFSSSAVPLAMTGRGR